MDTCIVEFSSSIYGFIKLLSPFDGSSLSDECFYSSVNVTMGCFNCGVVSSGKNTSDKYLAPTYLESTSKLGFKRGSEYS